MGYTLHSHVHTCTHPHTHTHTDKHSDHFILCKVPQAVYADHFLHKCVTVPLAALPGITFPRWYSLIRVSH